MADGRIKGREALEKAFKDLPRNQMPFAASLTINAIANDIKRATDRRLIEAFASPRAFTRNAAFMKRSNKRDIVAVVGIKERQARYLLVQETGGVRPHKAFERALRSSGVMDANEYAMPTGVLRPTRALFATVLSKVRGGGAVRGKPRKVAGAVFVPQRGSRLHRGIWRRMRNGRLQPIFIFTTDKPDYQPRLRFKATARMVFERVALGHAKTAAKRAIATAR